MSSHEHEGRRRIRWPRRRRSQLLVVALVAVTAVVPVAWANHQFSDVPTGSPHHGDISSIVAAGITGGCGAGVYCPDQAVRRDQMASFLTRGLPRLAMDSTTDAPDLPSSNATVAVIAETMVVAGVSGTQYVKVDAFAQLNTGPSTACPCTIEAQITDTTTAQSSPLLFYDVFAGPGGDIDDVVEISFAFTATPGTHNYRLDMAIDSNAGVAAALPLTNAAIMVTSSPFNQSAGGGALSPPPTAQPTNSDG